MGYNVVVSTDHPLEEKGCLAYWLKGADVNLEFDSPLYGTHGEYLDSAPFAHN